MPIRTHRGRAAVYRRFWGAPMRSPKHLAVTVVGASALVAGIGIAIPNVFAEEGEGDQRADTDTVPGNGTGERDRYRDTARDRQQEGPPRLTEPRSTPTPAEPEEDALEVASQWADAWVQGTEDTSNEEWVAGLEPYTTEEYVTVLESVEPANIPAEEVTGEPTAHNSYTNSAEVDVPTDGPTLRLTVINTGNGWLVTDYEQAG